MNSGRHIPQNIKIRILSFLPYCLNLQGDENHLNAISKPFSLFT